MAESDIQRYLDGIESQHKTAEKFMSHLSTILEYIDAAHSVAKDMPEAFYLAEAEGKQLDTVALSIGLDRRFPEAAIPGTTFPLEDDLFRKLLYAKIVKNQWDGTEKSLRELWTSTMEEIADITYHDNQDMSIDVSVVSGVLDPVVLEMFIRGYLFPKPLGVRLNTMIRTITSTSDLRAACVGYANYAKLLAYASGTESTEASCSVGTGSKALLNEGTTSIRYTPGTDQQDEASVRSGAHALINYAYVSVIAN